MGKMQNATCNDYIVEYRYLLLQNKSLILTPIFLNHIPHLYSAIYPLPSMFHILSSVPDYSQLQQCPNTPSMLVIHMHNPI